MSDQDESQELEPCLLGKKEYWESVYKRDIKNFSNHGDVGEVWFGEDSALRILRWLVRNVSKDSSIVDLGCGNGMMLVELAREEFTNLTGFDYCEDAISLAKSVIDAQSMPTIKLKVADLTSSKDESLGTFDVALDKGTYDAICLNPDDARSKREIYIKKVNALLTDNGFFVITSCNWTAEELSSHFDQYFLKTHIIPTPSFQFGGQIGSLVSSVVFKKKPGSA